jgi:hypothetical protein
MNSVTSSRLCGGKVDSEWLAGLVATLYLLNRARRVKRP